MAVPRLSVQRKYVRRPASRAANGPRTARPCPSRALSSCGSAPWTKRLANADSIAIEARDMALFVAEREELKGMTSWSYPVGSSRSATVQAVARFARHFGRSPAHLGPEQIRAYQVYLTNERRLAPSSLVVAVLALRFLYRVTLQKRWANDDVITIAGLVVRNGTIIQTGLHLSESRTSPS